MSYATLLVYVNADHVSKQLVGVAADLADRFSAKLIGVSALAVMPPVVASGVVVVDNATEFDIAQMKAKLEWAGEQFRAVVGGRPSSRMAIIPEASRRNADHTKRAVPT